MARQERREAKIAYGTGGGSDVDEAQLLSA